MASTGYLMPSLDLIMAISSDLGEITTTFFPLVFYNEQQSFDMFLNYRRHEDFSNAS